MQTVHLHTYMHPGYEFHSVTELIQDMMFAWNKETAWLLMFIMRWHEQKKCAGHEIQSSYFIRGYIVPSLNLQTVLSIRCNISMYNASINIHR